MPSIRASGRGGTARNVDIDRDYLIDAHYNGVGLLVGTSGTGTATHGNDPFRGGHLFVEELDGFFHLLDHRAGDDHEVGLSGRGPRDYAEAVQGHGGT